jgi:hypothetical protein
MGHKSLAVTERYSHLAPNHLRRAANRLDGILEAPGSEASPPGNG